MHNNRTPMAFLFALSFAFVAAPAHADGLDYSYAEVGYISADIAGIDGDGFGVGASFAVSDAVFAKVSYSSIESEDLNIGFGWGTVTISGFAIGAGWHTPVSESADFVIGLGYSSGELESSIPGISGALDTDATSLTAGLRGLVTERVELFGNLSYIDADGGSDTTWDVGGLVHLGTVSVGLSYTDDEDVEQLVVGLRFGF